MEFIKPSILVVDDNGDTRAELQRILASGGLASDAAADGIEAMEKILDGSPPRIVITDVCMPEVDGFELASWIRDNSPSTSVVMVTGLYRTEDMLQGYEVGADYFITKPFGRETVLRIVRYLTGEDRKGRESLELLL